MPPCRPWEPAKPETLSRLPPPRLAAREREEFLDRAEANQAPGFFAVTEADRGGDAHDAIAGRKLRLLVGVHVHHASGVLQGLGCLLCDWTQPPAVRSPGCPEHDHHRHRRAEHVLVKRDLSNLRKNHDCLLALPMVPEGQQGLACGSGPPQDIAMMTSTGAIACCSEMA